MFYTWCKRKITRRESLTANELHALSIGLWEILCPWKPRYKLNNEAEFTPFPEYHYYLGGRALGFPLLLLILISLAKLGKELLL